MLYYNNLKIYRWRAGFDKAYEFAAKLGIPSQTLSMIERGRANPKQNLKVEIVSLLDNAMRAKGEGKPLNIQDVFPS